MSGPEYTLAEAPTVQALVALGYRYLPPENAKYTVPVEAAKRLPGDNNTARDGDNLVLLRDEMLAALQRLNDLNAEDARAAYQELLKQDDNQRWLRLQRGDFSRTVSGQATKKTIRLIDFLKPENNSFVVTNQLYVNAAQARIPDIVIYLNGMPLVVIEAKSPFVYKNRNGKAFEQIKQYERDIPRLFASNAFNIITDGENLLYGATGAASLYWSDWKDPWPKQPDDFSTRREQRLYSLLAPSRLLDLLAHFILFEKQEDSGLVIKKICRYQQFRAVNKMVDRVVAGKHKTGLVWHTQGSGKSLTMAYTALKLKRRQTLDHPALNGLSLLVITDRIDLDVQIAGTFKACGLRNPVHVHQDAARLHSLLYSGVAGQTVISTIFKLKGAQKPAPNNGRWVVLADECHRTQEGDLAGFMRAAMPEAVFFGFTGTPVKQDGKSGRNTYHKFGPAGETYLDKYSLEDAVADGATVPIRYQGRKLSWDLDGDKLDATFDEVFADRDTAFREEAKRRGLTFALLAKHQDRIQLLAADMWNHFEKFAKPNGFKAQIVAIDREAVILYKRALDKLIAEALTAGGMDPAQARTEAATYSTPVYSGSQEDGKPSEALYTEEMRRDLTALLLDAEPEKAVKKAFKQRGKPPWILIVCSKLLTGFDAPAEAVMYLDKPLREHNLLQAIARTNRTAEGKPFGLIVDYMGVTANLRDALSAYRWPDVSGAMKDLAGLEAELADAHREVLAALGDTPRQDSGLDLRRQMDIFIQRLGNRAMWLNFKPKAQRFLRAYDALSGTAEVLVYRDDLKWVAALCACARAHFETDTTEDFGGVTDKIRPMLAEHLRVNRLWTAYAERGLDDPSFMAETPEAEAGDEAAQRQQANRMGRDLKREIDSRMQESPQRFLIFSDQILALLRRMESGLDTAGESIRKYRELAAAVQAEDTAYQDTDMDERCYMLYRELAGLLSGLAADDPRLKEAARAIDELYSSDEWAPPGWHEKEETCCKPLRGLVKRLLLAMKVEGLSGNEALKAVVMQIQAHAFKHYMR